MYLSINSTGILPNIVHIAGLFFSIWDKLPIQNTECDTHHCH